MKRSVTLLLLLATVGAQAAEVAATIGDGKLGARIDAIAFPASLPKELTSGLTNRLYARVSLMDAEEIVSQRSVEIAIRYDLWDEKYSVVNTMDGVIVDSRSLAGATEMNALLRALPLPDLFDLSTITAARRLVLRVDVLLNPIDREKMRMIRKWVAQNSTPGVGGDQGISMSNAIFNRIFEQYADGSNVAAAWRVSLTSTPFTVESLSHEGR
jgi:hypothetical protein